jgi:hypothetical protein
VSVDAVWTRDELISAYPELIDMPGRIGLTPWSILTRDVPEEFQDVIPYAELWGVGDDGTRDNLVDRAPATVLENLVHVVVPLGDRLDPWLAGPEASGPSYTDAYVAFSCLRMAAEYAVARLRRHSS